MKKGLLLATSAFAFIACSLSEDSLGYPESMDGTVWETKAISQGKVSYKYKVIFSEKNAEFRLHILDSKQGAYTLVSDSKPAYIYTAGSGGISGMVDFGNGKIILDNGIESTVFTQNGKIYVVTPNGNKPLSIKISAYNMNDSFDVERNELTMGDKVYYRQ